MSRMRIRVPMHQVRRSSMKSVMKGRILQALASRARVARVLAAVVVAGLLTAACGGSTEPGVTASVTVSPTTATIPVTGTQQFTVVVKNAAGDVLAVTPTWSIVSGGGTITQSGLFTAGPTAGTSIITVLCSGINPPPPGCLHSRQHTRLVPKQRRRMRQCHDLRSGGRDRGIAARAAGGVRDSPYSPSRR